MSYRTKMMIPVFGMAIIIGFAAISVTNGDADEIKQRLPPSLAKLEDVKLVEIKDSNGQVILSGNFTVSNDKDELERKAVLTGAGADARGEAEIEISSENGVTEQELEISLKGLAPGTVFKLFVDAQEIATFTTSVKGEAELEFSNEHSR